MAEPRRRTFSILGVLKIILKKKISLFFLSTLIHLGPGGIADGFCTDEAGNACKFIPGWNGPPD